MPEQRGLSCRGDRKLEADTALQAAKEVLSGLFFGTMIIENKRGGERQICQRDPSFEDENAVVELSRSLFGLLLDITATGNLFSSFSGKAREEQDAH